MAGPGTGKSLTSVWLVERLQERDPELRVRMVTFTRSATQALTAKLEMAKLKISEPSTIHSYALGLLMGHPALASIPTPLRIPDSVEQELIHKHIAEILRKTRGFSKVKSDHIEGLEREMASQWETLDEEPTPSDPRLQAAYVGAWKEHRATFGYTLLSELPFQAWQMLRDHEPPIVPPDLLVVDEYQDLNRVDIALVRELAERGTRVIAIGDPDQSIYSFRLAAPEGIREFPHTFEDAARYRLSLCFRSGEGIVRPARMLIDTSTEREKAVDLKPNPERTSRFCYARFKGHKSEAVGVAKMIAARHEQGVALRDIAVLVRAKAEWFQDVLEPELQQRDIDLVKTDWVENVLAGEVFRKRLCHLRLAVDRKDSLAWWVLLHRTRGIADAFINHIYEVARSNEKTFGATLLGRHPQFRDAPSGSSIRTSERLVRETLFRADRLARKIAQAQLGEKGWGGWIVEKVGPGDLSESQKELLLTVGDALSDEEDLNRFLGQLTPIAKDLASRADAVRLMTMTESKGLTVDSAFVMGVEEGLVPHPKGHIEEEKRLLYVAMTRAERFCVLSFAKWRRGRTGRQGAGRTDQSRGRSPLLSGLPGLDWTEGDELVSAVQRLS
jgi:DNA helicase-2/ATP-dependent DNA helicase PcrA